MKSQSTRLTTILAAAALGAAAMYVLDPDKGRRRRAVGRDKVRSLVGEARSFANAAARDANHRLQGVRARVQRRFRPEGTPDDLMLIERVRARIGRVVSHPHAIQVGANRGVVMLSGPILAHEVEPLLAEARSVPGVDAVEDHLAAHEHADSIPSLQGGGPPRTAPERWSPAVRAAALVAGTFLAIYGSKNRSPSGVLLAAVGAGLAARGATNMPIDELADLMAADKHLPIVSPEHLPAPRNEQL
jgi:hypothetical protein